MITEGIIIDSIASEAAFDKDGKIKSIKVTLEVESHVKGSDGHSPKVLELLFNQETFNFFIESMDGVSESISKEKEKRANKNQTEIKFPKEDKS